MELETDTAGRRYAERRATAAAQRDNLIALINTWNEATSPSTPRTEDEHAIQRVRARCALLAIKRNYREGVDYRELSTGALWPMEVVAAVERSGYFGTERAA